jgi:hypothetical protein
MTSARPEPPSARTISIRWERVSLHGWGHRVALTSEVKRALRGFDRVGHVRLQRHDPRLEVPDERPTAREEHAA